MKRNLNLVVIFVLLSSPVFAQFEHNEETHKVKYHNAAAIFIGNTIIRPSGFNLPTIGFEYLREVNHFLGIGIMAEVEIGSHIFEINEQSGTMTEVERNGAILLIPTVFARVYKGLIFSFGYGVEFEKDENLGLLKFSMEYKLHMKNERFVVLPTVSWDHTHRFDGLVYGVNFGYIF